VCGQQRTGRVNIDLDNIDSIKVIKGVRLTCTRGRVIRCRDHYHQAGAKMGGTASSEKGSFNYNKNLAQSGFPRGMGWTYSDHLGLCGCYYDQGKYSRNYWNASCNIWLMKPAMFLLASKIVRAKDSHGTVTV